MARFGSVPTFRARIVSRSTCCFPQFRWSCPLFCVHFRCAVKCRSHKHDSSYLGQLGFKQANECSSAVMLLRTSLLSGRFHLSGITYWSTGCNRKTHLGNNLKPEINRNGIDLASHQSTGGLMKREMEGQFDYRLSRVSVVIFDWVPVLGILLYIFYLMTMLMAQTTMAGDLIGYLSFQCAL